MEFSKTTFPNGLRAIFVPMPNVSSVTVMILVGAGSRFEEKKVNGITHFLEHMVFKGTKKRPTAKHISTEIDSIGGEFNAATGKENTAYYIKALATHIGIAFDVLCDMLLNSKLDSREIEREKNVIAEEIALYEDTPIRKAPEYFETLLYPNSSLGWDISGTKETVGNVRREDFLKLLSLFYSPDNMVVVVSGGFDQDKARRLTKNYLGEKRPAKGWSAPRLGRGSPLAAGGKKQKERFVQTEPQVFLKTKKTEQTHLVLGVRGNPRGHQDRFIEEVLASILGGGMSSRLWIAVRVRRGLAYYVHCELEHHRDNGYLAASAGVDNTRVDDAIRVILDEFDRVRRGKGLTDKELKKAKEFVKGHLALDLENTMSVASLYGSFELFERKALTPKEIFEGINKVARDDVVRVAGQFLVPENLNLALIGPHKDGEYFKKLLSL